jgi:hypothetical protein
MNGYRKLSGFLETSAGMTLRRRCHIEASRRRCHAMAVVQRRCCISHDDWMTSFVMKLQHSGWRGARRQFRCDALHATARAPHPGRSTVLGRHTSAPRRFVRRAVQDRFDR